MSAFQLSGRVSRGLAGLTLLAALTATGCQSDFNGQTLPSPYYLSDDVQYFPPGPQMKVANEAAQQRAFREDQALRNMAPPAPTPLP